MTLLYLRGRRSCWWVGGGRGRVPGWREGHAAAESADTTNELGLSRALIAFAVSAACKAYWVALISAALVISALRTKTYSRRRRRSVVRTNNYCLEGDCVVVVVVRFPFWFLSLIFLVLVLLFFLVLLRDLSNSMSALAAATSELGDLIVSRWTKVGVCADVEYCPMHVSSDERFYNV